MTAHAEEIKKARELAALVPTSDAGRLFVYLADALEQSERAIHGALADTSEHTEAARTYARQELGMADDEPNEATGVETFTRYSLIAEAFDAGRALELGL